MNQTAVLLMLSMLSGSATAKAFEVEEQADRLIITASKQPVAEFVFRDAKILRPFFANVHAPGGLQVTRNHPPQPGDPNDHDTMHPGLWLAFGDVNGNDFWRNKARIEHVRFTQPPAVNEGQLKFATESKLIATDGGALGRLTTAITLQPQPSSWLLDWDTTLHADESDLHFGDQEEMGFGARLATPLIERNGGQITNSRGLTTAAQTWGQPAVWCDYSGKTPNRAGGLLLAASPANFREPWWHNRDYGLFVANPFGRAAMKQGEPSTVTVRRGEALRLRFAALIHDGGPFDPVEAVKAVLQELR